MRTLKRFYELHVTAREDIKMFVLALLLIAIAMGLSIYDTVTIVRGTVNPNDHMPFMLAFAFLVMSQMILFILRRT